MKDLLFALLITVLMISSLILANNFTKSSKYTHFSKISILHEGRVKPMDSFAKAIIKPLTNSDKKATEYLIKQLFTPQLSADKKIIKINHPDTLKFLQLDNRKRRLYSYKELKSIYSQKEALIQELVHIKPIEMTLAQKEILHLYDQLIILRDLKNSLGLFVPITQINWHAIPKNLRPKLYDQIITYYDLLPYIPNIHQKAQEIAQIKGADLKNLSPEEENIAQLSYLLTEMGQPLLYSDIFKVIDGHAPWEIIRQQKNDRRTKELMQLWRNATLFYYQSDIEQWQKSIDQIIDYSPPNIRLKAEYFYHQIPPFFLATILFSLSFLIMVIQKLLKKKNGMKYTFPFILAGIIFQFLGILTRIYILQRPPVSTLYESILFVAFVCVLYSALIFWRNKKQEVILFIGTILGIILYLIACFNDQTGDTFLMLSAVLNTNFWLATHVLVITIGYGLCLITSGLAHYTLIKAPRKNTLSYVHKTALWALFFCSLGTILGGIWADQSWGRFWGWDPKENGALLIVLWLIWLLHGKISRQIGSFWFYAGMAYLSVIVGLSWFGVNILSIGLHAYGFTDSALWALISLIVIQTSIILFLARRDKHEG